MGALWSADVQQTHSFEFQSEFGRTGIPASSIRVAQQINALLSHRRTRQEEVSIWTSELPKLRSLLFSFIDKWKELRFSRAYVMPDNDTLMHHGGDSTREECIHLKADIEALDQLHYAISVWLSNQHQ